MVSCERTRNRSSYTTSLATNRFACSARAVPARAPPAGLRETLREPGETARAELHRLHEAVLLLSQRAGRIELLRLGNQLRLLGAQSVERLLEIAELDPRPGDRGAEIAADPIRRAGHLRDVSHVVLVGGGLAALAARDPDDQKDDQHDQADDERG